MSFYRIINRLCRDYGCSSSIFNIIVKIIPYTNNRKALGLPAII